MCLCVVIIMKLCWWLTRFALPTMMLPCNVLESSVDGCVAGIWVRPGIVWPNVGTKHAYNPGTSRNKISKDMQNIHLVHAKAFTLAYPPSHPHSWARVRNIKPLLRIWICHSMNRNTQSRRACLVLLGCSFFYSMLANQDYTVDYFTSITCRGFT